MRPGRHGVRAHGAPWSCSAAVPAGRYYGWAPLRGRPERCFPAVGARAARPGAAPQSASMGGALWSCSAVVLLARSRWACCGGVQSDAPRRLGRLGRARRGPAPLRSQRAWEVRPEVVARRFSQGATAGRRCGGVQSDASRLSCRENAWLIRRSRTASAGQSGAVSSYSQPVVAQPRARGRARASPVPQYLRHHRSPHSHPDRRHVAGAA